MIYRSIESLRISAAIFVLLAHMPSLPDYPFLNYFLSSNFFSGSIGVDIFFIISGFVIHQSLQKFQQGGVAVTSFLIARAFRLFPLYLLLTLVVSGFRIISDRSPNVDYLISSLLLLPYLENSTYIDPIVALGWTLQFELFFYLIASTSLFFKKIIQNWIPPIGILCSVIMCYIFGFYYGAPIVVEFIFGFLLSIFIGRIRSIPLSLMLKLILASISVFIVLLVSTGSEGTILIGLEGNSISRMSIAWGLHSLPRWFIWGIPSLLLVFCCLLLESDFKWRISSLGKYTYSLYLTQYISVWFGKTLSLTTGYGSEITALSIVILSIGFSYFSYLLIEHPWILFGKKISNNLAGVG